MKISSCAVATLVAAFAAFAAFAVTAAAPIDLPAQTVCKRPAAKNQPEGTTITIAETKSFPCTVQFVNTGVVLRSDPDGKVEEIGSTVARGPDGRFYTSMNGSAQVTVWNANGSFLKNFGARGQGPGEFAAGPKRIFFDPQKRLVIGDNNRRWSVFSPSYEFVRTFPAATTGTGVGNSLVLLADGTFLTSFRGSENAFHIVDVQQSTASAPAGAKSSPPESTQPTASGATLPVLRAFGTATPANSLTRPLTYSNGNSFWAGPPDGAGLGYFIELWSTAGKLLRTIRRDAPWVPTGTAATDRGPLPPPEMEVLHEDGTGLVFVVMMIPNKTFLTLTPDDRKNHDFDGPTNKAIDIYFEVIDANAGVVLASSGLMHPAEVSKMLPSGFLAGSRLGYRRVEDKDGFPSMHIVEAKLFAK